MNKKEVNLTIDSRIISHLGEALIDNEKIALLELIKNASDADANYCNIEIDTLYQSEHGQGRIIIEDDGNGMTPYIIENAFLKIATSFKSNHQKVSPKFKRQAQGNKGIGRLSLNQLGKFISVDTKVDLGLSEYFSLEELRTVLGYDTEDDFLNDNDFYYYHIDIDWERYSKSNESIENVKLELQTLLFNELTFNHKKDHGTRIEVLGLKGIDFWQSNQTQKEIEQDVLEFLNPYLDEKYNFYVKINLDNRIFTSNKYDISDIENSVPELLLHQIQKEHPCGQISQKTLRLIHSTPLGNKSLDDSYESLGTMNIIKLLLVMYDVVIGRKCSCIDEIEYGIHTKALDFLLKMYLTIADNCQLVVATHDLSLLKSKNLRRDAVRMFEKDKYGVTQIKRKYVHNTMNFFNAYEKILDEQLGLMAESLDSLSKYRGLIQTFYKEYEKDKRE